MSDMTLTNDDKRCLQMWFRQAIVEVERREALNNIIAFYNGDQKKPVSHHSPIAHRARRAPSAHAKELV
ncbi:MAG TPA: hypothetical protein V6D22_04620 [Candidatus Obscuribacterales bacterium]